MRRATPGARHFTDEWRQLHTRNPIEFRLHWIPFTDDNATPQASRHGYGRRSPRRWANPGNGVRDPEDGLRYAGTEFARARQLAYKKVRTAATRCPRRPTRGAFKPGQSKASWPQNYTVVAPGSRSWGTSTWRLDTARMHNRDSFHWAATRPISPRGHRGFGIRVESPQMPGFYCAVTDWGRPAAKSGDKG